MPETKEQDVKQSALREMVDKVLEERESQKQSEKESEPSSGLKSQVEKILNERGEKAEKTEHEQATALTRMEIAGIPVGEALTGGGIAFLAHRIVENFFGAQIGDWFGAWAEPVTYGGLAYAMKRWGSSIPMVGTRGADLAALFLAWEALNSAFDLRTRIEGLFAGGGGSPASEEYEVGGGGGTETPAQKVHRLLGS